MNSVVNTTGLHIVVEGHYQTAIEQVVLALRAAGFEIAAEINLEEILESHIPPYRIIVVCHPELTRRALLINPEIGVLLPCNVAVSQLDDYHVEVRIAEPLSVTSAELEPHLKSIVEEIHTRLMRVAEALKG